MHTNVENVLERDRKLGDLEERADALQDGCAQFEKQVYKILRFVYFSLLSISPFFYPIGSPVKKNPKYIYIYILYI